jgi:hypothetical protein
MLELTFILIVVFTIVAVVIPKYKQEGLSVEAREAVITLLRLGACIEFKKWHLYKTQSGKYALMQFDDKSNVVVDSEKFFADINRAVDTFVESSKGATNDVDLD